MSALVEELKQDHIAIINTLKRVKELGFNSEEGQKTLNSARNIFIEHLSKEDTHFYPVLHNAAKSNDNLKSVLEYFTKDMDEISQNVLEFFTKYSGGGSGIEFAQDFGTLYATLTQRVRREESIIYKEFDKLNQ